MKKILLLAACASLSFFSIAQITITRSDMPASRDTFRYSTASNTIALKFDTTGPNMVWDYDSLKPNGQDIDTFKSALSINPIYGLYFGLNDYGRGGGINQTFGTLLQLNNIYNFYKTTSNELEINGLGAEYNSIPLPSAYTNPDKIYQFPLTYGRIDTTPYDVTISVPGVAGVRETGTRFNTVDGWGTIKTPFGTFPCIRLKSVTSEVDSVRLTALGFNFALPARVTTSYKWLANGVKIPVLEVTGNVSAFTGRFTPTAIKYRDNIHFIPPQFNVRADFRANRTICTTLDTITITNRNRPNPAGTIYLYSITPSTFTFVSGTGATSAAPRVVFNATGLYTVSLHVESPAGGSVPAMADTTKVDYITVNLPNSIAETNINLIQVYPNPADDRLLCQINGDGNEQVAITLTDIKGRAVYITTVSNNSMLEISTSQLPAGEYLLSESAGKTSIVRKVQIIH